MDFTFGRVLKVTLFGQSHAPAVGVVIDGLPAGIAVDFNELEAFMRRRAPGQSAHVTPRREADTPEFVAGLVGGVTCGAPLTAVIRNTDTRPGDYEALADVPRPGHADYTAYVKYGSSRDTRGGGQFSGRLTAPLCVAGGVCLQILRREGVDIAARLTRVGETPASSGDEAMLDTVEKARQDGDSVGGVVECTARGVPPGLGGPLFGGMESRLAAAVFAIPAVKGVEFGNGFACAALTGSENNDAFAPDGGKVVTLTNNHGGVLGGITSGMPLVFRAAFKPTPSIAKVQKSVSLSRMEQTDITVTGRHDPCVALRAAPCVEAAAALVIYDAILETRGR
ncbi:MAG: chorismate synthase [Oscillospiraceae bacterium]|nr:chorismate synthase [Oscillospiraceae bacterium]